MRAFLALPAVLLAACFDPSFHDPTCGPGGACPDGYTCESDDVCRRPAVIVPDADPNAPDADPNAPDAHVLMDAPIFVDAPPVIDAPPGECADWTFEPSNVPCTDPTGSFTVTTNTTYDTDDGTWTFLSSPPASTTGTMFDGGTARVISVDSFQIGSGVTLTVRGSLPLIILVDGTATLTGNLEAGAAFVVSGPGGLTCSGAGQGGLGATSTNQGGGGGGGGGFGTMGASGGDAQGAGNGQGGSATSITTLSPLRGGCRGGDGGAGPGQAGGGGGAGGAIQISARGAINASGAINAGGGGAGYGMPQGGGAGGAGSGGGILLEAPAVSTTGSLCANGGAGGEGSGSVNPGNLGGDGKCAGAAFGGSGGNGTGGDGGDGGYQGNVPQFGGMGVSQGGGGGGGGGAGIIRIRGALSGTPTIITPAATTVPL